LEERRAEQSLIRSPTALVVGSGPAAGTVEADTPAVMLLAVGSCLAVDTVEEVEAGTVGTVGADTVEGRTPAVDRMAGGHFPVDRKAEGRTVAVAAVAVGHMVLLAVAVAPQRRTAAAG
jgi:hypothetical protein